MNRRSFLKKTGLAAGMSGVQRLAGAGQGVSLVVDPQDKIASAAPVSWAIGTLQNALNAQKLTAKVYSRIEEAPAGDRRIIVAGSENDIARRILNAAKVSLPAGPEGLALVEGNTGGRPALLAAGTDERGLVYAVLELADRVKYGSP